MSATTTKLDDIMNMLAIDMTDTTLPERMDIAENAKRHIQVLILETFGDALIESKSVEEMGEKFRQKVLSL